MEITIPEVGESVREALLAKWFKNSGDRVSKDEALCEIETDKITLDIHADAAGTLTIKVAAGTTLPVGAVVGTIADQAEDDVIAEAPAVGRVPKPRLDDKIKSVPSSPSIRREMREKRIDPETVTGTGRGGRITQGDLSFRKVEDGDDPSQTGTEQLYDRALPPSAHLVTQAQRTVPPMERGIPSEDSAAVVHTEESPRYDAAREERRPMSPIRRRIAEHLVAARQQTAMLTTFNEADLSRVNQLRATYRDQYRMLHGAPLGLMPFFVKACVEALKAYPVVNASIDGDDLVYHNYFDIGIAIGAEKGLVVPILRDADRMELYEIDQAIATFAEKIKTNRLAISDIEGGTFSISNGGVYGSMLSTPIINIPQSGVLGMHAIQDRPVAREGQVVIRPMMYLALSYDHRIIDGREAVSFLKRVREVIENPERLLSAGQGGS
jgi:2-oxoglutarate dehydrogenase E2 component (dihydrolipoamide succinyltransferase)